MRQVQKFVTLGALLAATALAGCASRQPATTVLVVPSSQAASGAQATASVRSGTVVDIRSPLGSTGATSQGASSGNSASSGVSSSDQLITVQFDDGQRQFFQVGAGSLQFQKGDRVTVDATQGMPVITRSTM